MEKSKEQKVKELDSLIKAIAKFTEETDSKISEKIEINGATKK